MQNVINTRDIIKDLIKHNLNVDDKTSFNHYIKNFNFNTVITNYSDVFYSEPNKKMYDSEASSSHLISLYKFDRDLGNHMLRYILIIEKILNTNVAYEIINQFNIKDKCLFKINEKYITQNILSNFNQVETHLSLNMFLHSLVKYCSTNTVTKKYFNPNGNDEIKKWQECPLDLMCLTWSFSTSFSIFIGLSDSVRVRIVNNFGLNPSHLHGLIDFIKNILHFRNLITHNYVIFNAPVKYQSQALNDVYEFVFNKKVQSISVMNIIEMIQHFSDSKKLVSNTQYFLSKMNMPEKFKNKITEQLNK